MPTVSADDIVAGHAGVLLDARAAERYRGEVEPVDPVAGHIPGAVSAPTTGNLGVDGRFLDAATLRRRFQALGVPDEGPVTAYCGSGVTAAHEILALEVAGWTGAALYAPSWSGWVANPSTRANAPDILFNWMTAARRREDLLVIERMEVGEEPRRHRAGSEAADHLRPVLAGLLGDDLPVDIECWDGSRIAATCGDLAATLRLVSPDAVRRLLWSPDELGLARGFVAGELEVDGDLFDVVAAFRTVLDAGPSTSAVGRRDPVGGAPPGRARTSTAAATRGSPSPRRPALVTSRCRHASATTTTSATTSTPSCSARR